RARRDGAVVVAMGSVAIALGEGRAAVAVAVAGVEALAGVGADDVVDTFVVDGLAVEIVERADEVGGFGELVDVDLAAADQIEDDLTELGEGVVAAAAGARFVEARPAFAGAALEGVAD